MLKRRVGWDIGFYTRILTKTLKDLEWQPWTKAVSTNI